MQKHDKMVMIIKEKSAGMTQRAVHEMEKMYRANEKITVAELMKRTGLSRGFFYNNLVVNNTLMEFKEKQKGMVLRNPKTEAIAKAQEVRIKSLEKKLAESVPAEEYELLKKKYEDLEIRYDEMRKGSLLNVYEQL